MWREGADKQSPIVRRNNTGRAGEEDRSDPIILARNFLSTLLVLSLPATPLFPPSSPTRETALPGTMAGLSLVWEKKVGIVELRVKTVQEGWKGSSLLELLGQTCPPPPPSQCYSS